MDTFGRLPSEILDKISNLLTLPEIEIINIAKNPQFCIKFQFVTIKFNILSYRKFDWYQAKFVHIKFNEILNKFIDDLSNNIDCTYNCDHYPYQDEDDYDYKFNIEVTNNLIKITNHNAEYLLSIESRIQLFNAMKRYLDEMKNL